MAELEAIKVAALHLEGEAQDWWFHGMVTLGHSRVTAYAEFMQRLGSVLTGGIQMSILLS